MTIPRRVPSFTSSFKCDSLSSVNDPSASDNSGRNGHKEDPAVVNARIEAQLKRDSEAYKKEESRLFKILLLGQAASGKSTTLKNFRMQFTREEWEQERLGWRAVIQLNVVRQVLSILHILESELGGCSAVPNEDDRTRGLVDDAVETWISESKLTGPNPSLVPSITEPRPQFTERHRNFITRLGPRLSEVEHALKSRLTPHMSYYPTMAAPVVSATPFEPGEELDDDMLIRKKVVEYTFRSWRDVLDAAPQPPSSASTTTLTPTNEDRSKSTSPTADGLDMPTQAIASLRKEIKALWTDADVRDVVKRRRLEIPDSIGFDSDAESAFLDEIDRIARIDYEVNDQDIVCARLKTVGIQEYTFNFDSGAPSITGSRKWSWRVYDVGGCRTMRKAWLPYFDNIQLIIFLAPVSVFDEHLEEDPRVNRLEDSIVLWSSICETSLLARAQIVLFLNKCDLLQRKLSRGVRVSKYLSSYGKRPNDLKHVLRYVKEKFKTIHQEKSPMRRPFTAFPTTVTDTSSTALTLKTVRDNIIRQHLSSTNFM